MLIEIRIHETTILLSLLIKEIEKRPGDEFYMDCLKDLKEKIQLSYLKDQDI